MLYPIVIAVLIGFALSGGPDKPKVAFYNGLEGNRHVVELGGDRIDLAAEGQRLFDAIDPVRVNSKEEAIQKVKDGEVLGALIIPDDLATNIQASLEPGTVEVYYNAEDPAKRQFVENTIKAQVQSANSALTKRVAKEALKLLDLISTGGELLLPRAAFDVLGLERAERILAQAKAELPPGSAERAELDRVIAFGKLARENLSFSDDVLAVVGEPIRVKATALDGGTTSLELVRGGARRRGIADVHHAAAGGRDAGARARGERLLAARPRAGVEDRPARREGGAGGGLLRRRLPADARGTGAVRGARLGPLPALARRPCGGRARIRGARPCDRRAHA